MVMQPFRKRELKLGKLAPAYDPRTLRLASIFKALPVIPEAFDVDSQFNVKLPTPMFANDYLGDCVIAGRAHMTLRFEVYEQRKVLPISDKNVTDEYFKETGGADSGLYLLDSLRAWRQGWTIDAASLAVKTGRALGFPCCRPKKKQDYNIYGFGSIDYQDLDEVKACIYLLFGAYVGVALPKSAQHESVWTATTDTPASWGRHCIYIKSYDKEGLTCTTWGRYQRMTWPWFLKYCDEGYGVVDDKNRFTPDSPVDVKKLTEYLESIQAI